MAKRITAFVVVGLCAVITLTATAKDDLKDKKAALARLTADTKFLASDEMEGRGIGTKGLEVAKDFIVDEYKKIGLKPGGVDGTYLQPFDVDRGYNLVPESAKLVLKGPQGKSIKCEFGKNFRPMMIGGTADLDAGMVFVGYGISADDHNFDEYAGVDVKDKIVVLIRREPQQKNESSVFDGTEVSKYAYIRNKCKAAKEAGAVGIIMINDGENSPTDEKDELLSVDGFNSVDSVPFAHVKRSVMDDILKTSVVSNPNGGSFKNLTEIEKYIDDKLSPVSSALDDWSAKFECRFENVKKETSNVIGVLEGEGPHADETIIIGGHYDHLGFGGRGSRRPGSREVHNGADDNATGTAAVIELARRYAKMDKKPARRMVFICFSAEESGLLGSFHYCKEPLFDMDKTIAMINYDMIGWLRNDKLTIYGTGSGSNFDEVLDGAIGDSKIVLNKIPSSFAGSDHMPFFRKNIPVMFLHTGLTDTYHTPEDDFDTLNMEGAARVVDYSEGMIWALTNAEKRPAFGGTGPKLKSAYLGVRFDYRGADENGVPVTRVRDDSPALEAGLEVGDVVQEIAGKKLSDRSELNKILTSNKAGSKITIKFTRDGEEKSIEVTLGKRE